jgi:hypothetical protein
VKLEVVSGSGNAPIALFCGRGRKTENFRWLSAVFPPHRQKMANGAIHRLEPVSLQPFSFPIIYVIFLVLSVTGRKIHGSSRWSKSSAQS